MYVQMYWLSLPPPSTPPNPPSSLPLHSSYPPPPPPPPPLKASLSGVGMGTPSSSFAGQNPYLARMSAESQRRSFAYIPPDVAARGPQPMVQTRPHEEQRRGGENGGVPRGGQATEGPKMVCTYLR